MGKTIYEKPVSVLVERSVSEDIASWRDALIEAEQSVKPKRKLNENRADLFDDTDLGEMKKPKTHHKRGINKFTNESNYPDDFGGHLPGEGYDDDDDDAFERVPDYVYNVIHNDRTFSREVDLTISDIKDGNTDPRDREGMIQGLISDIASATKQYMTNDYPFVEGWDMSVFQEEARKYVSDLLNNTNESYGNLDEENGLYEFDSEMELKATRFKPFLQDVHDFYAKVTGNVGKTVGHGIGSYSAKQFYERLNKVGAVEEFKNLVAHHASKVKELGDYYELIKRDPGKRRLMKLLTDIATVFNENPGAYADTGSTIRRNKMSVPSPREKDPSESAFSAPNWIEEEVQAARVERHNFSTDESSGGHDPINKGEGRTEISWTGGKAGLDNPKNNPVKVHGDSNSKYPESSNSKDLSMVPHSKSGSNSVKENIDPVDSFIREMVRDFRKTSVLSKSKDFE